MKTVSVHEAKTHLSELLRLVHEGREIVIARNGQPVARLVRYRHRPRQRKPGRLAGRIIIKASFDEPLPESLLAAFRGEGQA